MNQLALATDGYRGGCQNNQIALATNGYWCISVITGWREIISFDVHVFRVFSLGVER